MPRTVLRLRSALPVTGILAVGRVVKNRYVYGAAQTPTRLLGRLYVQNPSLQAWPLPTILMQFMQSPLPVVTVVTNPPPPIGPTLRSRNSNPLHCLWSPTGHRHTQPDTGLKLEKQIICAATKEYVPKFQLATIITTSHSGLTNCNYCLVIVT